MKRLILIIFLVNVLSSPGSIVLVVIPIKSIKLDSLIFKKILFHSAILAQPTSIPISDIIDLRKTSYVLTDLNAAAKTNNDSVYNIIRQLISPSTKLTRTSKLDSASAFHANYLIETKKVSHYEYDRPQTQTPMKRAQKFGDSGMGIYEVCWGGTPKYEKIPKTQREAIHYFKNSDKHWDIMTRAVSQFTEIRFGYCRIETEDWSVCVIIYSTGPIITYQDLLAEQTLYHDSCVRRKQLKKFGK